jgi:hypothetical protein
LTEYQEKSEDNVKEELQFQAFIERGFRTIKEEFLNLAWIGNRDKFRDVLKDAKCRYNNKPNSAFDYRSPIEVMNAKRANLPQQVCGH